MTLMYLTIDVFFWETTQTERSSTERVSGKSWLQIVRFFFNTGETELGDIDVTTAKLDEIVTEKPV